MVAGLPDLFFDENTREIFNSSFLEEWKNNLSPEDYRLFSNLLLPSDNENFLNLLFEKGANFDESGNFSRNFLENQIDNPTELLDYFKLFLKWIKTEEIKETGIKVKNKLYSGFYEFIFSEENIFLKDWFTFELNLKNILTAVNCEKYGLELDTHLIKTSKNGEIYSLLLNKRFKPEYFEEEIPFVKTIIQIAESNSELLEKEKAIDKIKWEYLNEQTSFHYFTIEKILSYIIKTQIIKRWMRLVKETGQELLKRWIYELKMSYEFPAEFNTVN